MAENTVIRPYRAYMRNQKSNGNNKILNLKTGGISCLFFTCILIVSMLYSTSLRSKKVDLSCGFKKLRTKQYARNNGGKL